MYKASWEFEFWYKLYLAKYEQIFLGTPHLILPEPRKYTVGNVYTSWAKKGTIVEWKEIQNE